MYHLHVYASLPSASPPCPHPPPAHAPHTCTPSLCMPPVQPHGNLFQWVQRGGGGECPPRLFPHLRDQAGQSTAISNPPVHMFSTACGTTLLLASDPPSGDKKRGQVPTLFSTARVKCRPSPPSPWEGFSTLLYLECSKCFAELGPWALPAPEPQRGAGPPPTGFSSAGEIGCKKGQIRHQPGRRRGGC